MGLLVLTMNRLFVYGTLREPGICGGLLGRVPESVPAILHGYVRHDVRDEVYPAIIPQAGNSVTGLVYENLSTGELAQLDAYEGDEYARSLVDVDTGQGNITVWAYVWQSDLEQLETTTCPPLRPT